MMSLKIRKIIFNCKCGFSKEILSDFSLTEEYITCIMCGTRIKKIENDNETLN